MNLSIILLIVCCLAVGSLGHFDQERTNGSKRGEREMHHLLRGKRPFNPVVRRENDDPILVQPVSQTFFLNKAVFLNPSISSSSLRILREQQELRWITYSVAKGDIKMPPVIFCVAENQDQT